MTKYCIFLIPSIAKAFFLRLDQLKEGLDYFELLMDIYIRYMKNILWDTHTKILTVMGHIEKQLWDRAYLRLFMAFSQ